MIKNPPANAGSVSVVGRSPGEEMATHSSILAWIEEPGRLQSTGSQRAGQDLSTELRTNRTLTSVSQYLQLMSLFVPTDISLSCIL